MTDKNTIRIHDSSFGVWWTAVDEDRMKKEVYGPIIRHLRDRGWKIGEDPQIKKNYPKLNRTHRYGRLGNLEMEMRICGRCVEVEFFQNVANVENRNGGRYDFHKLDRMPYLLHLKTIATLRSLTRLLTTSGDYVIQDKEEPHKAMRKTKITAMECLKARYSGGRTGMPTTTGNLRKAPCWSTGKRFGSLTAKVAGCAAQPITT
jgi:hypothetical protein